MTTMTTKTQAQLSGENIQLLQDVLAHLDEARTLLANVHWQVQREALQLDEESKLEYKIRLKQSISQAKVAALVNLDAAIELDDRLVTSILMEVK